MVFSRVQAAFCLCRKRCSPPAVRFLLSEGGMVRPKQSSEYFWLHGVTLFSNYGPSYYESGTLTKRILDRTIFPRTSWPTNSWATLQLPIGCKYWRILAVSAQIDASGRHLRSTKTEGLKFETQLTNELINIQAIQQLLSRAAHCTASCRSRLESQWDTPTSTPRETKIGRGIELKIAKIISSSVCRSGQSFKFAILRGSSGR